MERPKTKDASEFKSFTIDVFIKKHSWLDAPAFKQLREVGQINVDDIESKILKSLALPEVVFDQVIRHEEVSYGSKVPDVMFYRSWLRSGF